MQVTAAEATELFVGDPAAPLQVVRVGYTGAAGSVVVRLAGDGLSTVDPVTVASGDGTVEVPVRVEDAVPGQRRAARVLFGDAEFAFDFTVAEPGWTMYMISHFHYDPVWWNTQGAYTSLWTEDPPGRCKQNNAFALVAAHLEMAR
ncbi:MAG: alpha-mannosidase, partial [Mycobacteriaceae bacterium]